MKNPKAYYLMVALFVGLHLFAGTKEVVASPITVTSIIHIVFSQTHLLFAPVLLLLFVALISFDSPVLTIAGFTVCGLVILGGQIYIIDLLGPYIGKIQVEVTYLLFFEAAWFLYAVIGTDNILDHITHPPQIEEVSHGN